MPIGTNNLDVEISYRSQKKQQFLVNIFDKLIKIINSRKAFSKLARLKTNICMNFREKKRSMISPLFKFLVYTFQNANEGFSNKQLLKFELQVPNIQKPKSLIKNGHLTFHISYSCNKVTYICIKISRHFNEFFFSLKYQPSVDDLIDCNSLQTKRYKYQENYLQIHNYMLIKFSQTSLPYHYSGAPPAGRAYLGKLRPP